MKITGLDALIRDMKELEKAVGDLDGDIAHVTFDPHDPQSIEQAIQQLYAAIDDKVASYAHNEIVVNVAEELKETGRNNILERAAAARLEGEDVE